HVALGTGAPIVPVAVIGPEEEAPLLADPAWLARLVRTPVAPLTPTLVVPLPVKYRIHFGPPLRVRGPAAPDAVARHVAEVRTAAHAERGSRAGARRGRWGWGRRPRHGPAGSLGSPPPRGRPRELARPPGAQISTRNALARPGRAERGGGDQRPCRTARAAPVK